MTNLPASAKPTADADPVSADGRLVSEAAYWEDWYDTGGISYEWNNGRLEEQPVSDFETFQVYLWFLELLRHFLRQQPIGQVVALEMGFRLSLASGTVIRKPDLAVVLNDNPVPLDLRDSSYHGVFDLCVEALSTEKPAHVHRDLVVKKAEYAAGGVPEYHVLHREHGNLAFYGLTPGGVYAPLPAAGTVMTAWCARACCRAFSSASRPHPPPGPRYHAPRSGLQRLRAARVDPCRTSP